MPLAPPVTIDNKRDTHIVRPFIRNVLDVRTSSVDEDGVEDGGGVATGSYVKGSRDHYRSS